MADKILQAIAYVKAGEKSKALELLGEILTEEPDNEQAWLWMSAVVSKDRQLYCIQKVLSINPNNPQARNAFVQLAPDAKIPKASQVSRSLLGQPDVSSEASSEAAAAEVESSQYYLLPDQDMLKVIMLLDGQILSAVSKLDQKDQVQVALNRGDVPASLLAGQEYVPFDRITEISQAIEVLRVQYIGANGSKSLRFDCRNKAQAEEIFNTLQERLGDRFERQQQALSVNFQIGIVFMLFIFIGLITLFLYYQSFAIISGDVIPEGGNVVSGLISTLYSLGPFGVLLIGGGVMLGLWIWMIALFRRPPQMTKLVAK